MIKRIVSLLFIFILFFSFHLSTSRAEQFITTVNGRNVNLDWSAMPASQSYTLYYALADFKGDIDVSTVGSIGMGNKRNLYLPDLPSGLIIYTAVVAHATQGDVVSNISRFMPFGGTITFPETGDVLIKMDDPGGVGNITVTGTKNADGSEIEISQISGDAGSGPFSISVGNSGDISTYIRGSVEIRYVHKEVRSFSYVFYENDALLYSGSASFASAGPLFALNSSGFETLAVSDRGIDCGLYRDEYMQQVEQSNPVKDFKMDISAMYLMYAYVLKRFEDAVTEKDQEAYLLFLIHLRPYIERTILTLDDVRAQEASRYDSMCG